MIIFRTIAALRLHLHVLNSNSKSIGFVPTMGALHAGHLSLIRKAQAICDVMVTSIFVNPTQFTDRKDFEKYPKTIDQDCLKLEEQQTDILFLPSVEEIYPDGTGSDIHFDLGPLETLLEGKYRHGHFQGVCQVVKRLLKIVQPHKLFLGQKDYQQCKIIEQLIRLMGVDIKLLIVPTMREKDGLAMSSRNVRLTSLQRQRAVNIHHQLHFIQQNLYTYTTAQLIEHATKALLNAGFSKVDYVAIADAETLQPITRISEKQKAIVLIAAMMGDVRLIDNMLLN